MKKIIALAVSFAIGFSAIANAADMTCKELADVRAAHSHVIGAAEDAFNAYKAASTKAKPKSLSMILSVKLAYVKLLEMRSAEQEGIATLDKMIAQKCPDKNLSMIRDAKKLNLADTNKTIEALKKEAPKFGVNL